jgi:hypothetical protein
MDMQNCIHCVVQRILLKEKENLLKDLFCYFFSSSSSSDLHALHAPPPPTIFRAAYADAASNNSFDIVYWIMDPPPHTSELFGCKKSRESKCSVEQLRRQNWVMPLKMVAWGLSLYLDL